MIDYTTTLVLKSLKKNASASNNHISLMMPTLSANLFRLFTFLKVYILKQNHYPSMKYYL